MFETDQFYFLWFSESKSRTAWMEWMAWLQTHKFEAPHGILELVILWEHGEHCCAPRRKCQAWMNLRIRTPVVYSQAPSHLTFQRTRRQGITHPYTFLFGLAPCVWHRQWFDLRWSEYLCFSLQPHDSETHESKVWNFRFLCVKKRHRNTWPYKNHPCSVSTQLIWCAPTFPVFN